MSLIKSFAEYCRVKKLKASDILPDLSMLPAKHRAAALATIKMFLVTEHLNDGWEPDWDNGLWDKWLPWFHMDKPGFRLVGVGDWPRIRPRAPALGFVSSPGN